MSGFSISQQISPKKGRVRRFRAVFYQRFEQMVDIEAKSEEAAYEAARVLLERGEIDPTTNWGKTEVDLDRVCEIGDVCE